MSEALEFASFWHGGPLNPFAYGCLAFVLRADSPEFGCTATTVASKSRAASASRMRDRFVPTNCLVRRYIVAGKPSIATFADMFRYRMIRETGCCWVDTDLVCLTRPWFTR